LVSLLDQSMKLGARRATLEVRVSNRAALSLYLKYGFEIVSRRKRYYTDNNEDAFIMTTPPFETAGFQTKLDSCRSQLLARLVARDANSTTQDAATSLAQTGRSIPTREQQAR
jgi:ribosomal-protein-alanine N-acetyltransferase